MSSLTYWAPSIEYLTWHLKPRVRNQRVVFTEKAELELLHAFNKVNAEFEDCGTTENMKGS